MPCQNAIPPIRFFHDPINYIIKMEFLKDYRVDAMDDLENPDDYWSKEQLDEWRKTCPLFYIFPAYYAVNYINESEKRR